jgi:hypothetical protein
MRAVLRADPAVLTDNGHFFVFVEIHCSNDTSLNTFAASDALFLFKDHSASFAGFKRARRTGFSAGALVRAAMAYDPDKAAR